MGCKHVDEEGWRGWRGAGGRGVGRPSPGINAPDGAAAAAASHHGAPEGCRSPEKAPRRPGPQEGEAQSKNTRPRYANSRSPSHERSGEHRSPSGKQPGASHANSPGPVTRTAPETSREQPRNAQANSPGTLAQEPPNVRARHPGYSRRPRQNLGPPAFPRPLAKTNEQSESRNPAAQHLRSRTFA